MGCAAQMAPAQGKCPGIHIKAAGFNYQLALLEQGAVSLSLFPCPLASLDFAPPS